MHKVAEVAPPKGDENMAIFSSVTVAATYERASRKVTVDVEACGELERPGIDLEEVKPSPDCYADGAVLCVKVVPKPPQSANSRCRWPRSATFDRSADYVVLMYENRVLTVRPVEKVDTIPKV